MALLVLLELKKILITFAFFFFLSFNVKSLRVFKIMNRLDFLSTVLDLSCI